MTVHWRSAKWIGPQLEYLRRNLDAPYRLFASLEGIDDPGERRRFDVVVDFGGGHADKLNALSGLVVETADVDDILLFLDGDAFPIRPIARWMTEVVAEHSLVAVQRRENMGDVQPHPCFCATTVGLWKDLGGDWRRGGTWTTATGKEVTDVGGTLLHQLDDARIDWLPLLRSNSRNPHALWFAVYGDRVYHHGAGFRPRVSRIEEAGPVKITPPVDVMVRNYRHRHGGFTSIFRHLDRDHLKRLAEGVREWIVPGERQRYLAEADAESERIYRRLLIDPTFFEELVDPG